MGSNENNGSIVYGFRADRIKRKSPVLQGLIVTSNYYFLHGAENGVTAMVRGCFKLCVNLLSGVK